MTIRLDSVKPPRGDDNFKGENNWLKGEFSVCWMGVAGALIRTQFELCHVKIDMGSVGEFKCITPEA